MARLPRLSPIDVPVHVLQRGNNRQAVFRTDEDYAFYLDTLRMAAREHDFAIHAFALMPNHGDELWQLVSVADRAMYNTKQISPGEAANDRAAYVEAAIAS